MAQDNSSKLTFTIEESVWLNKGQEIEEVISMSLNPDISIEERNDHVQIKGGLRLIGEYRPVRANEEEMRDIDDLTFRSIEEVSQKQDGFGEVKHFFPIDVTIPLSRINNLQDVFVEVQSFDYDLPDRSCIQLTADIVISGMNVEQKETVARTEDLPVLENDTNNSFEYEATIEIPKPPQISIVPPTPALETKQEEERGEEQNSQEASNQSDAKKEEPPEEESTEREVPQLVRNEEQAEEEPVNNEQQEEELVRNEERAEEVSVNNEQQEEELVRNEEQAEEKPVNNEQQEELVRNEEQTERNVQLVEEDTNNEAEEETEERVQLQEEEKTDTKVNIAPLKKMAEQQEEVIEAKEETIIHNEEKEAPQASKPRKDENALYLTKMLSNGEEQFSKLRMCIIQPNESLDMIAERYNISSTQIIRMNRLENERLEEGQILYIPVGKNR